MISTTALKALAAAAACAMLLTGCAGGPMLAAGAAHTDKEFAQVQRGMTRDEVLRLLGRPDETMKFPLSHTDSFDYRYQDPWGYLAYFSVTFDAAGMVASTISWRVNVGGDHGSR
jgi:outer membrane protein assembly factor BamE (lipoprotein component of BamABCDE complex)